MTERGVVEEYTVDEKFLKSVAHKAQSARAVGGLHTPDPSLRFVELQLLHEISNRLAVLEDVSKSLIEMIDILKKPVAPIPEAVKPAIAVTAKATTTAK